MKIAGSYILAAPAAQIWPLILDPAELLQLIPGCEQIEEVSPGEYRGRLNLRIAALGGTFQTYLKLTDSDPPKHSRFAGEVVGPAGRITGQASFRLTEAQQQHTTLEYEGQALITGALGSMNSRLVEGVAQALIRQGLDRLNARLQAQAGAALPAQTQATNKRGEIWRKPIRWMKRCAERLLRRTSRRKPRSSA